MLEGVAAVFYTNACGFSITLGKGAKIQITQQHVDWSGKVVDKDLIKTLGEYGIE